MRRLIAAASLAVLLSACGSGAAPRGLSLKVDTNPFRLTLLEKGKTLVTEDEHARLRYQIAPTGDQYSLTKVISSHGNVYRVATSEPGRTATVTVTRRRAGYRVSVQLRPATNVQQVFDAFETSKSTSSTSMRGSQRSSAMRISCWRRAIVNASIDSKM